MHYTVELSDRSALLTCRFITVMLHILCALRAFRVSICFCQAEDGIRDLVRSRGLGDVYKRQTLNSANLPGANLSGANLREVNAAGANLDRTNLLLSLIHI